MEIEEKYFEDIFYKIENLWQRSYFLEYGNKSKTYILSIADSYDEVEYTVNVEYKEKYDEWDRMLVFTMYSTLTDYGLENLGKEIHTLNIDEIPIQSFEQEYLKNLRYEGNDEFLKKYKGFKNR